MNKKEIIKRMTQNGSLRAGFNAKQHNVTRDAKIIQRAASDGSQTKILTLRILTDSDSPIYTDMWGDSYIERIGSTAFDKALTEVSSGEKIVYSFADHDMKIKSVISSTNREGTKFYKDANNDYIYEMELDESIPLHKQIIKMMENKELQANSFIFYPISVEVEEAKDAANYDYIVTQSEGDLLSIDPVLYAFYPQNEITMKGSFMTEIEKREIAEKAKLTVAEAEKRGLFKSDEEKAAAAEAKKAKEAEVAKKAEEAKAAKEAEEAKKAEAAKAAEEAKKVEEAKAAKEKADAEKQADTLANDKKQHSYAKIRSVITGMSPEAGKAFEARYNKNLADQESAETQKREALANKLKQQRLQEGAQGKNMDKIKRNKALKLFERAGTWAGLSKDGKAEKREEVLAALRNSNEETIENCNISEDELAILGLTLRDLTGASASTGAQVISVVTDPNLVGAGAIMLPEAEGAIKIPTNGLRETQVPVDVDDEAVAAAIAEGVEIPTGAENVIEVRMTPTRYGKGFKYNQLLQVEADLAGQKTTNKKNSIIKAWRKQFADGLKVHAAVAYSTVQDGSYTGGFTLEGVQETETSGTLVLEDVATAISTIEEKYGTSDLSATHKLIMNAKTWRSIVKSEKATGNDATVEIVNTKGVKEIAGVPVVLNGDMDDIAAGNFPVALYAKKDVRMLGGTLVISDSSEVAFMSSMQTRKVEARGQIKLADPLFNGKLLKVAA